MNTPALELPTGEALEREIEDIEARTHDERIRQTILDRVNIANDTKANFIPHDEVFTVSRARLMAKLTSKGNG